MPSPRAVLADLKKLKLDTKKAWSAVGVNGHLRGKPQLEVKKEIVDNKAEIPDTLEKVSQVAMPEQVSFPQEEAVVQLEAEVKATQEVIEENQDSSELESDFFRSKKKKKN